MRDDEIRKYLPTEETQRRAADRVASEENKRRALDDPRVQAALATPEAALAAGARGPHGAQVRTRRGGRRPPVQGAQATQAVEGSRDPGRHAPPRAWSGQGASRAPRSPWPWWRSAIGAAVAVLAPAALVYWLLVTGRTGAPAPATGAAPRAAAPTSAEESAPRAPTSAEESAPRAPTSSPGVHEAPMPPAVAEDPPAASATAAPLPQGAATQAERTAAPLPPGAVPEPPAPKEGFPGGSASATVPPSSVPAPAAGSAETTAASPTTAPSPLPAPTPISPGPTPTTRKPPPGGRTPEF
ncbi:Hypothetical protein CAP_2371 [Chondromyces apiculatus DSM 436]|uniref:Uncharacterized protein n=2 Tax=Chondromyces apiculatus TaxID=51 RepID=A0A017TC48_9BACT|nr:Hypothetical protein CAP_2371 [Chondromyces apiculatus DSM 436]